MRHIPAMTVLLIALFASCKKDKDTAPTPVPTPIPSAASYSQLAVGNYWIYEEFTIDTTGNIVSAGQVDSCYVEKDTTINSNTYRKLVKNTSVPYHNILFLRDSSTCIVNEQGTIYFSSTDFTTHFDHVYRYNPAPANDTIYESWAQMYNEATPVVLPAGSFQVLDYRVTSKMYGSFATVAGEYRYMDSRYCKNIGLVSQTLPLFVSNPNHVEMRLLRYHLN